MADVVVWQILWCSSNCGAWPVAFRLPTRPLGPRPFSVGTNGILVVVCQKLLCSRCCFVVDVDGWHLLLCRRCCYVADDVMYRFFITQQDTRGCSQTTLECLLSTFECSKKNVLHSLFVEVPPSAPLHLGWDMEMFAWPVALPSSTFSPPWTPFPFAVPSSKGNRQLSMFADLWWILHEVCLCSGGGNSACELDTFKRPLGGYFSHIWDK